jgi:hypothetical protein
VERIAVLVDMRAVGEVVRRQRLDADVSDRRALFGREFDDRGVDAEGISVDRFADRDRLIGSGDRLDGVGSQWSKSP